MKKLLMIGLLILTMTSTGWAYSSFYDHATGEFDHVTISQGDVGDLLLYPVYLADGSGWETKISVINTSNVLSTVAKVVIRGGKNSQELLDFFIYLSPDDMWTAKIYNDNGVIRIFSDDDSVLSNVNVWANTSPMNQAVQTYACEEESYGYVTIFDAWTISRAAIGVPTGPVAKSLIFTAFNNEILAWESANILTGFYEMMLPTLGLSASENAVVLKDYDVNEELTLGRETRLGESSDNSIAEVEAVLSKDTVYMPYYNDGKNITAHVFTFVTKEAILDLATTAACDIYSDSPFYFQYSNEDWCVEYGLKVFDLQEHTPGSQNPIFSPVPPEDKREFCEEVNINVVDFDESVAWYDEGWALYTFQMFGAQETLGLRDNLVEIVGYTGAPVIPLSANLGSDGLTLKYGAFSPASIYNYGTVND